jgi:hypothetical protein
MHIHGSLPTTTAAAQSYSAAQIEKTEQKRRADEVRKRLQAQAATDTSLTSEETVLINHWTAEDTKPSQYYY